MSAHELDAWLDARSARRARSSAALRAGDPRRRRQPAPSGAFVARYGMRLGAARFVAGETLDECVGVLRRLAGRGLHSNTTLLGESVRDAPRPRRSRTEYERDRRPARRRAAADERRAEAHAPRAGARRGARVRERRARRRRGASRSGSFVRIDMEQSSVVDATLAHLPPAPRERSRARRHGASVVPLPQPRTISRACSRSSRTCGS